MSNKARAPETGELGVQAARQKILAPATPLQFQYIVYLGIRQGEIAYLAVYLAVYFWGLHNLLLDKPNFDHFV